MVQTLHSTGAQKQHWAMSQAGCDARDWILLHRTSIETSTRKDSITVVLRGSAKYSCICMWFVKRPRMMRFSVRNGVRWRREVFPLCGWLLQWRRRCEGNGQHRPNRRVYVQQRWMRIAGVRTCVGLPWRSFWEDGSRGGSWEKDSSRMRMKEYSYLYRSAQTWILTWDH